MAGRAAATVLICGFGAFGALHAEAWRRTRAAPSLTACDPDPAARDRARAHGVERIADEAGPLLDEADIVDIVTPPHLHLPLALAALSRGKPVLLEKPAVRSVAEAHELLAALETAAAPLQVGMVLRCHPLTAQARDLLEAGAIGRLLAIEGDFSGWKRMRADSSLVENDGVHFLDLMRLFAGGPPRAVEARARALLGGRHADDIRIDLAFEGGVATSLRLGVLAGSEIEDPFVPGAMTTKTLRLIGEAGNVVIDFNRNRLFHGEAAYVPSPGGWQVRPGALRSVQAAGVTPVSLLARGFDLFAAALAGDGAPVCGAREGALEMALVLEGVERALARPAAEPVRLEA